MTGVPGAGAFPGQLCWVNRQGLWEACSAVTNLTVPDSERVMIDCVVARSPR